MTSQYFSLSNNGIETRSGNHTVHRVGLAGLKSRIAQRKGELTMNSCSTVEVKQEEEEERGISILSQSRGKLE